MLAKQAVTVLVTTQETRTHGRLLSHLLSSACLPAPKQESMPWVTPVLTALSLAYFPVPWEDSGRRFVTNQLSSTTSTFASFSDQE